MYYRVIVQCIINCLLGLVSDKHLYYLLLYNTLLNSDRLIGCLWSCDIE
jgi:hypothetical protein